MAKDGQLPVMVAGMTAIIVPKLAHETILAPMALPPGVYAKISLITRAFRWLVISCSWPPCLYVSRLWSIPNW